MTEQVYLIEATVYDPAISGTKVLRYASREFITEPGETPANTPYLHVVINPGNFEQNMFSRGATSGRSETGFGVIVLNNADGHLDGLLEYGFDGRELIVRRGVPGAAYPGGFTTVFKGTMEQAEFDWKTVRLRIRDRQAEVADKPMQPVKFAGTNSLPSGVEGVADDLKGRPKPRLYGRVFNIAPPLVNTSKLTYQISDAAIQAIDAVYDKGVTITAGTSHASLSALQGATPGAGTYDYYSGGDGTYFRLGSSPDGVVTCDATEGANSAARTVAQIIKRILTGPGGISAGDINATAVTALDTANASEVGIWIGIDERKVGDALDEVANSINAYWSASRTGEFVLGRLELPSGSAVATLYDWMIADNGEAVQRLAGGGSGNGLPRYKVNLGYKRNYTVMTGADFAGSVSQATRNFLGVEYRYVDDATAVDATVQTKHPLALDWTTETLLISESAAEAEAARLLTMHKQRRDLLQVLVPATALDVTLNIGNVVELDVSRFGLTGGKLFRVLGVAEDYASSLITLTLWG